MKFEQPPMSSPEEMARTEKERALSDAELLKDGAEYKFNEKGEKRLDVTDEQIEEARKEMEKDSRKSGELKSTQEMIVEQLSLEKKKLQEKKDAEKEKIMEKFEKSLDELQKDIKQGNIVYRIDTPIAPFSAKDEKADFLLAGEKLKDYQMYGGGIRNCSKEQLNRRDGGYISRSSLTAQFEPRIYSDKSEKEKIEFLKKSNAFIALTPVNKVSEYYEKNEEKRLSKFFKKEQESIKIRKELGEAKIKDLTEKSFIGDKNPEEKIFHLNIAYQNEVYPKDTIGMSEEEKNQRNLTRIAFYIGEKEANNILNGIRVKPEKIWEIINRIEPNLLNAVPPRQESFYDAHALLVKIQGKEDEILQWPQEIKKALAEKPETPPELPPGLPPSAEKISDKRWGRGFPEIKEWTKTLLRDRFGDWIEIGKRGIKTRYGTINGPLIWVDDELMTAGFDTPEGKFRVPINELLDPLGIPYSERNKEKEQRRRSSEEPPQKKDFSR